MLSHQESYKVIKNAKNLWSSSNTVQDSALTVGISLLLDAHHGLCALQVSLELLETQMHFSTGAQWMPADCTARQDSATCSFCKKITSSKQCKSWWQRGVCARADTQGQQYTQSLFSPRVCSERLWSQEAQTDKWNYLPTRKM